MKKLTLIVHESAQQELGEILRSLPQVTGFTFIHVEGHGARSSQDVFLSERDRVVGFVPRVRVDVLLADDDVADVLAAVRDARMELGGRSVYWVTAVEDGGAL